MKYIRGIVFMIIVAVLTACAGEKEHTGRMQIVTTNYVLYDFAKTVAGDAADVTMLIPPGVEVHSFEPTPMDIKTIADASVFIYTGKYMEPWAERVLTALPKNTAVIVDTSKGIELTAGEHDEHHESHHEDSHSVVEEKKNNSDHDEHEEGHHAKDPHIWLDPLYAERMVAAITDALMHKDAKNAPVYIRNAEVLQADIMELHSRCEKELATLRHRTIVYAGHFAFGYFAKRYDLQHISPYTGFSPNAEPTPAAIKEMIAVLKKTGQTTVFFEELTQPRIAEVLKKETGATLVLLHGVHNVSKDEFVRGVHYTTIMHENIDKLLKALR